MHSHAHIFDGLKTVTYAQHLLQIGFAKQVTPALLKAPGALKFAGAIDCEFSWCCHVYALSCAS